MFIKMNANPYDENIDDCLIRAITLATGKDYFDVFDGMCETADCNNWDIDELRTAIKYLTSIGWEVCHLEKPATVKQFSKMYTDPMVVIVKGHATFTKDGNTYDTWNPNRYHVNHVFRKCE